MRILQVTATYPPSINGVAIVVENLKKNLEKKGHEVFVLAPKNKVETSDHKNVIRYPSLDNPMADDYPIPLFPGIRSIYKLIEVKKFDIVHVHHPFHIGYFARIIAKRFKIPLVYTYHTNYDAYAENYLEFLPKNLKRKFVENTVYKFCKKADLIISPSDHITKKLGEEMPYLRISTIKSAVSGLIKTKTSKKRLREQLHFPKDKRILLSVSRLSSEKSVDLLIRSMQKLGHEYVLVLVGDGPVRKKLERLSVKLGVGNRVIFTGRVEHSRVANYYQAADVFYYASKTETQGLIFLEALTMGLPIIATSSAASCEWVKQETGLVVDNDVDKMAKAVNELFSKNPKKFRESALNYSKKFSQNEMTEKHIKSYSKIIADKKESDKLLNSGWQSWSPSRKKMIRTSQWNYNPTGEEFIPSQFSKKKNKRPISGWCSWYAYGDNIDEEKILKNVRWFTKHKELPIECMLIDDGWCRLGDWDTVDSTKFPHGLKRLAFRIRNFGFTPGIWVSPFLADPNSKLFNDSPNWFVRKNGRYVDGFRMFFLQNLVRPRYILDIRKKHVRKYILDQLEKLVETNNFGVLKLDYLYSVYFTPNISGKEAGGLLHELLREIGKTMGSVYTIACGCPLVPAVGVVDSMRIGPDIASPETYAVPILKNLLNSYKLKRVSGNINERLWTRKYWNLDPDVFVCRMLLGLSDSRILQLQNLIKKTKGNIFLGDDMTQLTEEDVKRYITPLFKK